METDTSPRPGRRPRRASGRRAFRLPVVALASAGVLASVLAVACPAEALAAPHGPSAPGPSAPASTLSAAPAVPAVPSGPAAGGARAAGAAGAAVTPEAELAALEPGYADCPALPAGVDPARWRCEVHLASPRLRIGAVDLPAVRPIMMVHAEGPMADGTPGQVWGAWRSGGPSAVPGGLTGTAAGGRSRLLGLTLEPVYGGRADFYTGVLSLRFALAGPVLPRGCAVGASVPVEVHLKRPAPSVWVSRNPPLVHFSAYDDAFTAPAPEGCGPLSGLLARRLGLPATSGNVISYEASYTFRMYDRLN